MDVKSHRYTGTEKLVLQNNSPDTLYRAYYHMYFNAFRPGSMMDVRSRGVVDYKSRSGREVSDLKPEEYGLLAVNTLSLLPPEGDKLEQIWRHGAIDGWRKFGAATPFVAHDRLYIRSFDELICIGQ